MNTRVLSYFERLSFHHFVARPHVNTGPQCGRLFLLLLLLVLAVTITPIKCHLMIPSKPPAFSPLPRPLHFKSGTAKPSSCSSYTSMMLG
jgi:hypothetical protein